MSHSEAVEGKVREVRRKTRRKYSAEERIRIVLEGLRGEESIAELCRREGKPTPPSELEALRREVDPEGYIIVRA